VLLVVGEGSLLQELDDDRLVLGDSELLGEVRGHLRLQLLGPTPPGGYRAFVDVVVLIHVFVLRATGDFALGGLVILIVRAPTHPGRAALLFGLLLPGARAASGGFLIFVLRSCCGSTADEATYAGGRLLGGTSGHVSVL
jgi:hypothetical protein